MQSTNAATKSRAYVRNPIFTKRHVRRKMTEGQYTYLALNSFLGNYDKNLKDPLYAHSELEEKLDYRRRRLLKACSKCAESKRKCNHYTSDWFKTGHFQRDSLFSLTDGLLFGSDSFFKAVTTGTERLETLKDTVREVPEPESSTSERSEARKREPDDKPENCTILDTYASSETSLLLHKPQSPAALTAMLFMESVNCEGVSDAWFNEVPCRLGHDTCFDLAIAALHITCWYKRKLPGATLPKVYKALASALEALKSTMYPAEGAPGDLTLAAVAALSPVEAIRSGHAFIVPSHLDGTIAILMSRATSGLSELATRILEYHFCDTYIMASIRGVFSSLEELDREYCKPCKPSQLSTPEVTLRALGNELCVRLPRLIAYVRACEENMTATAVSSALALAAELSLLKDEEAENSFLYLVGLAKCISSGDLGVTSYSLQFKTVASYEAAAYYWHTRTALLRLCRRLRTSYPTMAELYALPTAAELQFELQRLTSNIFMSSEFARTLQARKRRRLFGQSLLSCWGTVKDYPDVFSRGRNPELLQNWILENINASLLGGIATLSSHDLDEAAELFAGGPLVGAYKSLFDSGRPNT